MYGRRPMGARRLRILIENLPEDSAFSRQQNKGFSPATVLAGEQVRWISALVRLQTQQPDKVPTVEMPWDEKPTVETVSAASFAAMLMEAE